MKLSKEAKREAKAAAKAARKEAKKAANNMEAEMAAARQGVALDRCPPLVSAMRCPIQCCSDLALHDEITSALQSVHERKR